MKETGAAMYRKEKLSIKGVIICHDKDVRGKKEDNENED